MKNYLVRNSAILLTGAAILAVMFLLALKLKALVLFNVHSFEAQYQNLNEAVISQRTDADEHVKRLDALQAINSKLEREVASAGELSDRLSGQSAQLESLKAAIDAQANAAAAQDRQLDSMAGKLESIEAIIKASSAQQAAELSGQENLKTAIASQTAAGQLQGARLDALALQGACDIVISALPIVIDKPGTYCLGRSFDNSANELDAITIASNDVVIDGRGHLIAGPSSPTTRTRGIISIDKRGLTVRNLRTEGFYVPVLIGDSTLQTQGATSYASNRLARDILIEGVRSDNPTFQGIYVSADNFTIRDNTVMGVGPSSVDPHSFATGIAARGNICSIHGNRVALGDPTGNGENVGISLNLGSGCLMDENVVFFDKYPQWGRNFGIWTKAEGGALPKVTGNLVSGAHYAYGPHGIFFDNASENAACSLFARRRTGVDLLADVRGNVSYQSNGFVHLGSKECPDDPKRAESRFRRAPSDLSAYAMATALAEVDPIRRETETLAWLLIAAEFSHTIAKTVAENPSASGYSGATVANAKKIAAAILTSLGPRKPGKS